MENRDPQRESRVVLGILGTLLACMCITLATIGYLVITESENILGSIQAQQTQEPQTDVERIKTESENWTLVVYKPFSELMEIQTMEYGLNKHTNGQIDFSLEQDKYKWDIVSKTGIDWWTHASSSKFSDFDLRVSAKADSATQGFYYGMMFGWLNSKNHYMVRIYNESSLHFFALVGGEWKYLATWKNPAGFQPGAENNLRVIKQGFHYFFFINDIYVGDWTDTRFPTGNVGLEAGISEPNLRGIVHFDNFQVRVPKEQIRPTSTPGLSRTPRPLVTHTATPTGAQVPNVVGSSPDKARAKVTAAGLQADFVLEPSTACAGVVYRQEPTVGTYVEPNSSVKLYVCREVESIKTATPIP